MLVQKHLFHIPKLALDIGESIPVTVGYETYGRLNEIRDNAILVCHPFAGTSHAAGRYYAEEPQAGWWDALIGPGKAFDTNRFFVIAVDTLCNLNVRHPLVVTTGPATINPTTGRPYGPAFPQVTIRDNVRLQYQLLQTMGITELVCVAGPGMGGFQALEWAVTYPTVVRKVISAVAGDRALPVFALAVCQAGIDAIMADAGYADDIARGISTAADRGANIISMSLGGSSPSSLELDAIRYANSKGVLVIAAAGNSGPNPDTMGYPGAFAEVVGVAALNPDEVVAYFSSRGINDGNDSVISDREVEVAGPGRNTISTYKDGGYATMSGTSMATPHIAGLAAKLWQGSASTTRDWLRTAAKGHDITQAEQINNAGTGYDIAAGYGLPQVNTLVQSLWTN